MTQTLLTWLSGFPPELATAVLAALPVTELRASIPMALTVFHLPAWSAFLFSLLGNAVPIPLVCWLFTPLRELLERRSVFVKKWMDRFVHRKKEKFKANYERYGALALVLFVAIPLPMTGIWTGALLAVLFHMDPKRSVAALFLGLLLAGLIVTVSVCALSSTLATC